MWRLNEMGDKRRQTTNSASYTMEGTELQLGNSRSTMHNIKLLPDEKLVAVDAAS